MIALHGNLRDHTSPEHPKAQLLKCSPIIQTHSKEGCNQALMFSGAWIGDTVIPKEKIRGGWDWPWLS